MPRAIKLVLAYLGALLVAPAANAQTHIVVWSRPFEASSIGYGVQFFSDAQGNFPVNVTLLSLDVLTTENGRVVSTYGLDVPVQAGAAQTVVANIEYGQGWWWDNLHYNVGSPGIYKPALFSNIRFEVSDAVWRATPEPAAWAMLVGGFGFAGAAMRKRRRSGAALGSA